MTALRADDTCAVDTMTVSMLGHVLEFESNSPIVLEHMRELVHEYRGYASAGPALPALHVRISVTLSDDLPQAGDIRHISHEGGSLTIHGAGVAGTVDPSRCASVAEISPALLDAPEQFRTCVLEPLVLALVSHFDRHPIHAAAILCDGVALLLAGRGGAGKSTLALTAARAGYHVLTDDVARIQLDPALRVWGGPARVRVRGEAGAKGVITLASEGPAFGDRVAVCILGRAAAARLDRLNPASTRRELEGQIVPGFDRFPGRNSSVMHALAQDGGFHLALTSDPTDALPLIATMFELAQ